MMAGQKKARGQIFCCQAGHRIVSGNVGVNDFDVVFDDEFRQTFGAEYI